MIGVLAFVLLAQTSLPGCGGLFIDYIARPTTQSAQSAYDCMTPELQTISTPQAMMAASASTPAATRAQLIGRSGTLDGNSLEFYVVDQDGTTYWYVLTLNAAGKIADIQ